MRRCKVQKRPVSIVLIQLLCLSASLWLASVAPNASCVSGNEPPLLDESNEYDAPASYEFEPAARALLQEQQEQINDLSSQLEELQAVNYQTTIMMYVFVAVSAFLALMLMFYVMFRRPAPFVRTAR